VAGLTVATCLVCIAWLIGRITSDRYGWSQWLLWIPTPAVMVVAAIGLAAASRPSGIAGRRRCRVIAWAAISAAILVYFSVFEHRLLPRSSAGAGALRLVHGSVQAGGRQVVSRFGESLIGLDGDVTIVNSALPGRGIKRLRDQLQDLGTSALAWPFVLVTHLPILEARPLVANAELRVAVFRLDATATLGRILTVYAIDLPSEPRRSRADVARDLRRILDQTVSEPPDVVVGDFNMTRNSAAMAIAFPDLEHAYNQAGWGYAASFHRGFPLYHIDHTLVDESVRAVDYELIDIGMGRHLVQVVELAQPEAGSSAP
jgi:hypothetical protein